MRATLALNRLSISQKSITDVWKDPKYAYEHFRNVWNFLKDNWSRFLKVFNTNFYAVLQEFFAVWSSKNLDDTGILMIRLLYKQIRKSLKSELYFEQRRKMERLAKIVNL